MIKFLKNNLTGILLGLHYFYRSSPEAQEVFLAVGDLVTMGNGPDVVLGVRGRVGDGSTSGEAGTSRHSSGSWKSSLKRMTHGFMKSC